MNNEGQTTMIDRQERDDMAAETLELPRCAFHPQGLGKRCTNDAIFAIVSPTKIGTFWYFPCCADCMEEAGELRDGTFFLAHMFGHGDDEDN